MSDEARKSEVGSLALSSEVLTKEERRLDQSIFFSLKLQLARPVFLRLCLISKKDWLQEKRKLPAIALATEGKLRKATAGMPAFA